MFLFGHNQISQSQADRIAKNVLRHQPLIDLHVDLPVVLRYRYHNDLFKTDYDGPLSGHVDLERLQKGGSGGFFSIAFAPCPKDSPKGDEDEEERNRLFLQPSNSVRDTLEQIDITHQLVAQYSDQIASATSPKDILHNFKNGKINHLIGVEGAHLLGNSLGTLRTFYDLGARYLTLTHTCHNAFADTSGSSENEAAKPLHGGLSAYGKRLIREMNRLGMIVDVSHTSDDTTKQAIVHSEAPVVFTHSGARTINNHTRNVPDEILELVSEKSGRDAVIGIPALPSFVAIEPERQTVQTVADHVEHIAKVAGKSRVAIGSDFDGFLQEPISGLEDVSKYSNLLSELASRGWTQAELKGLVSGNFLRVFGKIESIGKAHSRKGTKADTKPWNARTDLGLT
ncbi:uncharacterized protein FA14DRAFT_125739 [Meira miltonrushii]|uniref:Dipeptidase n=1 Tax=Meira miltonrushii TaxID=1280837 RepID=A0A316V8D5_9BASI|nr:uncharacterized protein FA14DRAFT_125739 [Meira miltonrushii]PWN32741.1 hypothetical protein FA14DRAFT_125739 [Meira miltonrushii]